MNDATLTWQASPSPNTTGYQVTWNYNGINQPSMVVPRTAAQDGSGYSSDFATANPTIITVQGGDVIDATVIALDATNNLQSTPVTPPAVVEPLSPPDPPANVQLVLS